MRQTYVKVDLSEDDLRLLLSLLGRLEVLGKDLEQRLAKALDHANEP